MPLTLYRRGKIWHYRGTAAGRRLRRSTRTSDKAIAERIASEAETAAHRSHLDGPGAHVTFAQASINYRKHGGRDGRGGEDRFLAPIEDHLRDTLLREITGEAIRIMARKLYPDAQGATLNRQVLKPAKAVINHAAKLAWCSPLSVKPFPENPKKKVPASHEWVRAFANQANDDGLPHLAALCLFMFGTGARIGEACALTWGDVDLTARSVTIRMGKPTPWMRSAHLPNDVWLSLANIPSNRNPDDAVFGYVASDSVGQVWRNVVRRAGIDKLTPHCCRHGFATALLRRGIDVKTVAKLGGWKDATTVLRNYAHALDDPTLTEALFDTNLAHDASADQLTIRNQKGKLA